MPSDLADEESLRYRRVILRGTYDAPRQVLIDNRCTRSGPAIT
jgi:cytochrome oxidase assembly protein ShyY1